MRNLREKTGRKPGGQPGHPGHTLKPVKNPDYRQIHTLHTCPCGQCGGVSLEDEPVFDHECRQVFDLPPLRLEVTEHRAEIKRCPLSGLVVKASFPAGVNAPVQYGPHYRGFWLYLFNQQLLPFDRLGQTCLDLFGQPLSLEPSPRTMSSAYQALAPVESAIIRGLHQAPAVNVDESGIRVAGSLHWLHVASTPHLTFYGVHNKRGTEAMDALGVLPTVTHGSCMTTGRPYYKYDALHALCNQHLLRELKFLCEECAEPWAAELTGFLLDWKEDPRTKNGLDEDVNSKAAHPTTKPSSKEAAASIPAENPARGALDKCKAANLLDRLEDYDLYVLAFLIDPDVPFTNNQAEQDIRMIKVKQNISGSFRSFDGAQVFARVRGYLSTCRKQGLNLWDACYQVIIGQPFMPDAPPSDP